MFFGLRSRFSTLAFRLVLFSSLLIAVITYLIATVVSGILDDELLRSMFKRGTAIAETVSGPASYSILAHDRLALDNLAARIQETQPELAYLAILDADGTVLAHNRLEETGTPFPQASGSQIYRQGELTVHEILHDGTRGFEFRTPVLFAGQRVGEVVLAFDATQLDATRQLARQKIALIALTTLIIGMLGALLMARYFTRPIRRLSGAMASLKVGDAQVTVPVTSHDEIGNLTRSFNDMARVIRVQRDNLVHYADNLEESYNAIVRTLAGALDARDNYTFGHSARVATLSAGTGRRLGFGHEELKELEMACLLHDIGKIRVPDNILNKQGPLDSDEYLQIKNHPVFGAQILELADSLQRYIPTVLHHHEWYDGNGYPHGLKGEAIPLHAQIVALADSYDAMTTSRPYRPGRSRAAAIEELRCFKGRQFDPQLTEVFILALADYNETGDMASLDEAACG